MVLSRDHFQIDTSKTTPLYHQIQENIIELIDLNLLNAGDSLPSEREMSHYYDVTRMTVRQAIEGLSQKGFVERQHGVGTFIRDKQVVRPFVPTLMGFSQRMREAGIEPTSGVLERTRVQPTPIIAHRLRLDADDSVIVIRRLRLANQEPLMIETSYLSYRHFAPLMNVDLESQSLYQAIETLTGHTLREAEHTLEPTLVDTQEASILGVQVGQPAMLVRVLAYSNQRFPIEYSKSVVRGDRCRYYLRVHTQQPILT